MRFTTLNPADAPKRPLESNRHIRTFLIITAAEIMLLTLMVVLFVTLRMAVDLPILVSAMLLVIGVLYYFFRQSVVIAQTVLIFCMLALEMVLFANAPPILVGFDWVKFALSDFLLIIFAAFDILAVYWIMGSGSRSEEEEEIRNQKVVQTQDFEDRAMR